MHTCTHAHVQPHVHTCMHTHMHMHTQAQTDETDKLRERCTDAEGAAAAARRRQLDAERDLTTHQARYYLLLTTYSGT